MKRVSISVGALMAAMMLSPAAAQDVAAQGLKKLSIVVFGSPSLGAFLPPVIKAQKLDEKNGLSITFEERTPDAYTAQFNSGEFQLGGSAALLTVGLADIRGVKVTYLAHGVPMGGELDYLDDGTLTAALRARRAVG